VRNFGVSGTTVFDTGDDRFYQKYSEYKNAMESKPHIVIIQFGTNDVMHPDWSETVFVAAYVTFIEKFVNMDTCPSIYLIVPEPSYDMIEDDRSELRSSRILVKQRINTVLPRLLREISSLTNTVLIDGFAIMGGNGFTRLDGYDVDFLHLNDLGYTGIAHGVAESVALHEKFYFISQKMQSSYA
jgi:lysophospholipase L1-like esterase